MKSFKIILLIIAITAQITSCDTSIKHRDYVYDPQNHELKKQRYTRIFHLNTEIIPKNLELTLVTQLRQKTVPGSFQAKTFTRRLLPNDFLAKGDTKLYLKNLTDKDIEFNLIALSIEHTRLPLSSRKLTIPARQSTTVPMGEINIDLRLMSLSTRIEYKADGVAVKKEHREKEYDLLRNIQPAKKRTDGQEREEKKYKQIIQTNN